jgi:hypothetical protein
MNASRETPRTNGSGLQKQGNSEANVEPKANQKDG